MPWFLILSLYGVSVALTLGLRLYGLSSPGLSSPGLSSLGLPDNTFLDPDSAANDGSETQVHLSLIPRIDLRAWLGFRSFLSKVSKIEGLVSGMLGLGSGALRLGSGILGLSNRSS